MNLLRLFLHLHIHREAFPIGRGTHCRQRCLTCGMSRQYTLGRDRQGPWQHDDDIRDRQQTYVLEKVRE